MNAPPQDIIVLVLNDCSNPGIDITTTETGRRDANLAIFRSIQKTWTHITATATNLHVCTKRLPMPSHKGKRDVATGPVILYLPKVDAIEAIRLHMDPTRPPPTNFIPMPEDRARGPIDGSSRTSGLGRGHGQGRGRILPPIGSESEAQHNPPREEAPDVAVSTRIRTQPTRPVMARHDHRSDDERMTDDELDSSAELDDFVEEEDYMDADGEGL
eukprot:jgi/Tetstr1/459225/TSEL_000035.t1